MNCYSIKKDDFKNLRPNIEFNIVQDAKDIYSNFALSLIELIKQNDHKNEKTIIIAGVGPVDFTVFAKLCNSEKISCENLITISMDEYLDDHGKYIPFEHPMCLRRYWKESFYNTLDKHLRPPIEQMIFPDPDDTENIWRIIEKYKLDITFAGIGINGHLAFNESPETKEEKTDEKVKNSVTRVVNISRETRTQLALGGTGGNWDTIPYKAITVGMREMLSAKKIQLYGMRTWHAGVLRRTLFGSISPEWPSSYIQNHPNVSVTWTSYAAELPPNEILQVIGK
jgi:glucosamine-6-phosphate deaminase